MISRRWISWVTLMTTAMTVSTLVVVVAVATREVAAADIAVSDAADVTVIDVFWILSAQQHTLPYSAAIQLLDGNAELQRGHSCHPIHARGC